MSYPTYWRYGDGHFVLKPMGIHHDLNEKEVEIPEKSPDPNSLQINQQNRIENEPQSENLP